MKKTILLSALLVFIAFNVSSQYCTFVVDFTYSFGTGITNVQMNSNPAIDRTSNTTENDGFTNTGLIVSVNKGQSYTFSLTANQDNMICGSYNAKVYIDYNGDYDFEDTGEEVAVFNNIAAGAHTATIVVPSNAITGQTRMRVALKMAISCGHIAITPCNIPADWAWHGEVEDYTLDIQAGSGVANIHDASSAIQVYPNPTSGTFSIAGLPLESEIVVFNVLGETVFSGKADDASLNIDLTNTPKGIYFIKIYDGESVLTKQIAVQ